MRNHWYDSWTVKLAVILVGVLLPMVATGDVPRASLPYRNDLIRESRFVWGMSAPVATFAGQIHQESAWNPSAQSPYAQGLTQFTPATAEWIKEIYPDYVGSGNAFEPQWAIRAMVKYNQHLWDRTGSYRECDHMAFTLSAYNGGLGWVNRDKAKAEKAGLSPDLWFDSVEMVNAGRSAANFKENRDYPRKILLKHQYLYSSWGPLTKCGDTNASQPSEDGSGGSADIGSSRGFGRILFPPYEILEEGNRRPDENRIGKNQPDCAASSAASAVGRGEPAMGCGCGQAECPDPATPVGKITEPKTNPERTVRSEGTSGVPSKTSGFLERIGYFTAWLIGFFRSRTGEELYELP